MDWNRTRRRGLSLQFFGMHKTSIKIKLIISSVVLGLLLAGCGGSSSSPSSTSAATASPEEFVVNTPTPDPYGDDAQPEFLEEVMEKVTGSLKKTKQLMATVKFLAERGPPKVDAAISALKGKGSPHGIFERCSTAKQAMDRSTDTVKQYSKDVSALHEDAAKKPTNRGGARELDQALMMSPLGKLTADINEQIMNTKEAFTACLSTFEDAPQYLETTRRNLQEGINLFMDAKKKMPEVEAAISDVITWIKRVNDDAELSLSGLALQAAAMGRVPSVTGEGEAPAEQGPPIFEPAAMVAPVHH